jgi:pimeloyl-ACP methyl ester carboxylesterase
MNTNAGLRRRSVALITARRRCALVPVLALLAMVVLPNGSARAAEGAGRRPPPYTPRFESGPCAAEVPADAPIECGTLTVAENRNRPQRAQVQLPVAIVRSQAAVKAPDPIVFLTGGPGAPALPIAGLVRAADLGGPRDVIVVSQRGARASTPRLDCPERLEARWAQLATADPAAVEQRPYDDAVRACHARLRASGVDLNSYNTVALAADVADLRVALKVQEWNLWGVSYGTTLAQEVMRDHPHGVRSVVLDSLLPPERGWGGTAAVHRAMDAIQHLLGGCAGAPVCAAAHPTLARDLEDVVAAFDAHPYQSLVTDPNTGTQRAIAITGRDLTSLLANLPANTPLISQFPQLVSHLKAGQYGSIDTLVSQLVPAPGSDGVLLSITCADRAHIDVQAGLRRLLAAHPEYEAVPAGLAAACPAWPVRPVPRSFNQPVTSTIPTLVLAGEWDPTTPAKPAREAAKHFKRSFFVELPGLGHVVTLNNPCPQSLLTGFIANPTQRPNTTCVQQMPEPQWQ